jgi:hypothetical protein
MIPTSSRPVEDPRWAGLRAISICAPDQHKFPLQLRDFDQRAGSLKRDTSPPTIFEELLPLTRERIDGDEEPPSPQNSSRSRVLSEYGESDLFNRRFREFPVLESEPSGHNVISRKLISETPSPHILGNPVSLQVMNNFCQNLSKATDQSDDKLLEQQADQDGSLWDLPRFENFLSNPGKAIFTEFCDALYAPYEIHSASKKNRELHRVYFDMTKKAISLTMGYNLYKLWRKKYEERKSGKTTATPVKMAIFRTNWNRWEVLNYQPKHGANKNTRLEHAACFRLYCAATELWIVDILSDNSLPNPTDRESWITHFHGDPSALQQLRALWAEKYQDEISEAHAIFISSPNLTSRLEEIVVLFNSIHTEEKNHTKRYHRDTNVLMQVKLKLDSLQILAISEIVKDHLSAKPPKIAKAKVKRRAVNQHETKR